MRAVDGVDWRALGFDDSSWADGSAKLGYGDTDEATVVGFGPEARFDTLTPEAAEYAPEPFAIIASHLRTGNNVVAVEMHQGDAARSDISFDLRLQDDVPPAASLTQRVGQTVIPAVSVTAPTAD